MPSSWLGPADGDYQSFTPARGDILEVKVVDGEGAEQGTLIVAVVSRQECHGPGEAFEGHCLGASDDYYRYWITEGDGRHLREAGLYHVCFKSIAECRTWRGKKEVVHTDHLRFVTPSDLKEGKIRWARTRDVKADILGQLAKFESMYPAARTRKKDPAGAPKAGDGVGVTKVSLTGSEEETGSDSTDSSEEEELVKKMAKLQAELKAAEKLVSDKKGAKAKKKAMKAMKAKDKGEAAKERKTRSVSPAERGRGKAKDHEERKKKKEKKEGEKDTRNKKRRAGSHSESSGEARRRKKKEKKRKGEKDKKARASPSGEEESGDEGLFKSQSSKKESRVKGIKDRGPFGSGPPVQFRDGEKSDSETDEESVFREAPAGSTSLSGQQKLVRYSQKYPGRLASRLLLKMKEGAARELVGANNEEGSTPPLASHFVLTVLMPQLGPKASLRTQRELRTLAKGLDLLARGETSQCADLLGQRIKALERAAVEGHWMSAQFLELLAPDTSTLLDRDEEVFLAREFLLEQKVRRYDKQRFPPLPPGGKGKDQKGEKGKGKGKGDKTGPANPKGGKDPERWMLPRRMNAWRGQSRKWWPRGPKLRKWYMQSPSNGGRVAQLWERCWRVSLSRKERSGVVHPVRRRRKICSRYLLTMWTRCVMATVLKFARGSSSWWWCWTIFIFRLRDQLWSLESMKHKGLVLPALGLRLKWWCGRRPK